MNNTQTKFAEIVRAGLGLGVQMAQKAVAERNIKFFEDAIADQHHLREVALRNMEERVPFEVWVTRARAFDLQSNIVKYDESGTIKRLNDELFANHAREYYDQYVTPVFDMPIDKLKAQFDLQIEGVQAMVNFLTKGVTEEDQKAMDSIYDGYTDMVAKATDVEMLEVLNPKL